MGNHTGGIATYAGDTQITRLISILILLVVLTAPAFAYERWECSSLLSPDKVAVVAIVAEEQRGYVNASEVTSKGLGRVWAFGSNGSNYEYLLVITPMGQGMYYDLSSHDFSSELSLEESKPSGTYGCQLVSTVDPERE